MDRTPSAVRVRLPDGRAVVLAELSPSALIAALKGTAGDSLAEGRAIVVAALRRVDERELTFEEADAEFEQLFPRTRTQFALEGVLKRLHVPGEEEVAALLQSVTITTGEVEEWTATLPAVGEEGSEGHVPARQVVLREMPARTVREAIEASKGRGKRSRELQELMALRDGAAHCITSIDGQAVDAKTLIKPTQWDKHFSVRETFLLGTLWHELHLGEPVLGEAMPVPGGA